MKISKMFNFAKDVMNFVTEGMEKKKQEIEKRKEKLKNCSTEELKEKFIKRAGVEKAAAGLLLKERGINLEELKNS